MKTVKDYINSIDTDELVDTYFYKYSGNLYDYCHGDLFSGRLDPRVTSMTVLELARDEKRIIREYIEYLKSIDISPSEDEKQGIIYAYNALEEGCSDSVCTDLLFAEDLMADPENCENYGYIHTEFSKILGFLVADNQYTRSHIKEVIANVLKEASFTGYRQECLQKARNDLKEFENMEPDDFHRYGSVDEMFNTLLGEDLYKELKDQRYKDSEESKKLKDEVINARCAYVQYSMRKERELLLKALKEAGGCTAE